MARIITEQHVQGAEKLVADALRRYGRKDWMVLHSVLVPEPGEPYPREVDFAICIPDCGVICLEVKGGTYHVTPKKRQWTITNIGKPIESPWAQAHAAMWAFKKCVASKFHRDPCLGDLPVMAAVAFAYSKWPEGVRRPPVKQFYDSTVVQDPAQLVNSLECLADTLRKRSGAKPTIQDLNRLKNLFYPAVHMQTAWTSGPDLDRVDRELLELTQRQNRNLLLAQDIDGNIPNPRVLFNGPAGTGKTVLAMKLARLRHEAGDRVAVVCHSAMLGQWLRSQLAPDITAVGNIMDVLSRAAEAPPDVIDGVRRQLIGATDFTGGSTEAFSTLMEDYGLEWVAQLETDGRKFNYLIVDELQYFRDGQKLELLNLALEGGLANGRWSMFGDFAFQDVVAANSRFFQVRDSEEPDKFFAIDPLEQLEQLCNSDDPSTAWTTAIPLEENCRNTRAIGKAVDRMLDADLVKIHPSGVEGSDVVYRYFDGDVGDEVLSEELTTLKSLDVAPHRVTLVYTMDSPVPPGIHGRRVGPWRLWDPLDPKVLRRAPRDGQTVEICASVQFAGMERDVVVVVCTGKNDTENAPEIFEDAKKRFNHEMYLCMTRAKGALVVVAHESMRSWIEP